jgi:enoyl-CoA hydratase/carnithine racemase
MALTGDRVSAADMERCGFVHKLVEREALAEEALQIAEMIAAKPPLSVRRTKISLQNLVGIHELLSRHAAADYDANTYYLKNTEDHKEAYTAFLEKRTPVFKGK